MKSNNLKISLDFGKSFQDIQFTHKEVEVKDILLDDWESGFHFAIKTINNAIIYVQIKDLMS